MTPTVATRYQRIEDALTASLCSLEKAIELVGQQPADREQRQTLYRLLQAARCLECATDALEDKIALAGTTLAAQSNPGDY